MRALADRWDRSRNHHALPRLGGVAPKDEAARAPALAEPPAETSAWWLTRSPQATFARRRIVLPEACARVLRAGGDGPARIVVEFNGARFEGATLAANERRCELDLGDALAQEMAEVLDEDDGLTIEMVAGRGQPTLAIHPYVGAAR